MPMFQHYQKDGLVGFDGGGDGHVLDLDTAVKDGVLGGRWWWGGWRTCNLCTGQTYERSNILNGSVWGTSLAPQRCKSSGMIRGEGQARVQALKELHQVVAAHATARKTVEEESKANLMQPAKISLMVDLLNEGSIETKINSTRLIEMLMEEKDFRSEIVSSHSLLVGLMRLVKDKRHPNGNLPGLTLLRTICLHKQVRNLFVSIGAIPQLVELLPALNPDCLESALFILDTLSSLPEGRLALRDCLNTIPNMVRLLMRVSESCTQYALAILWSVCKLAPEECSSIAVEAGLAAKLLLVIQSGCNPVLKQRSAELLKLCSLNYTDTTFISKCKLTKTIQ
ncbi:U-box domain-containing protein 30 [Vitis vinifera]|uniref:U-box domain-containing protein n=1 Tax=Vitis vinifera TaxID=29760 RepID=A0A438KQJ8_VITVI|nr:U-box domain-containing protein 30 [Vitis vinifera]